MVLFVSFKQLGINWWNPENGFIFQYFAISFIDMIIRFIVVLGSYWATCQS